jgi:uncharacterized protein
LSFTSCIYAGTVVHKRLLPRRHGFSYRVFALCLDVDEIEKLDTSLTLFSRNRRNLLSFRDTDLGRPGPAPIGEKARGLLADAGLSRFGARIEVLCYPRIAGYVFNPLSVYFCRDADGVIGAVIYEVTNTFGERMSYVIESGAGENGSLSHGCEKQLYVSPYTGRDGRYSFHIDPPADRVVVGVSFRENGLATLKTHFRGGRVPLTDATIARMLLRHPLMTVKVIGAIHLEAAKLWAKGVPLVPRHTSPAYSSIFVRSDQRRGMHA